MITPRFRLSQDALTLTIKIRAPYCNLKDLDISVEKNNFIFVCNPYYLRLNLPGNILENDTTKSSFDSDNGEFTFVYEKENNEEFPNLDFITTFLQPKTVEFCEGERKIEVLTSEKEDLSAVNENFSCEYGFALRGGYNFQTVNSEFTDVFKIDPYHVKFNDRRTIRALNEKEKFNVDHYIADLMDDVVIMEICKQACPWKSLNKNDISFNEKELDFLKDLPNVNFNLTTQQINYCYNSLVEILFAYCYDRRTTFFEGTCESDWTISNISASLSWFDSFSNPKEAIICAYRRSVIYPLYRSFKLCDKVLEDLKLLLGLDIKYVIHCLIHMHDMFLQGSSGRYVLNKLFIDDYIIYMMKCNVNSWEKIVETVSEIKISKNDLGLNLHEIEKSMDNVELTALLGNLNIDNSKEDSDDVSSNFESDDSTDSDDSESDNRSDSDSSESYTSTDSEGSESDNSSNSDNSESETNIKKNSSD